MIEQTRLFRGFCFLACALAMPGIALAQMPQKEKEYAQTYHEPFKGPPRKAEDFTLVGADAANGVKFEPDGLRITLPAGVSRGPTGVATKFGVTGDFEITVHYEFLKETNFSLAANLNRPIVKDAMNRPIVHTALMSWSKGGAFIIPRNAPVAPGLGSTPYVIQVLTMRKDAVSITDRSPAAFPATEKSGRFRMVRIGEDITYYLSEGLAEGFTLVATHPFGADDLKDIQIYGTSNPKSALDVRFTDLQIRAAGLPRRASPKVEAVGEIDGGGGSKYAREYRQTFQGLTEIPKDFVYFGPNANTCVEFEPEGMRIKLPLGHTKGADTGVVTRFGVKGDFEITLKYEFLQEPDLKDAVPQTRFSLFLTVDNPQPYRASINHHWTGGPPELLTWMTAPGPAAGKTQRTLHFVPVQAKAGKLRLTRTGSDLSYFAAEGDGDFKFLRKYAFAAENVKNVRIAAATGGPKASLDVRVTDLVIRAGALPTPRLGNEPKVPTKDYAQTYFQSFKGQTAIPPGWELNGPSAEEGVQFEPAGLRIKLAPNTQGSRVWAGAWTAFGVKGDYEITLNFELLKEPEPADVGGSGTSLTLLTALDTPNVDTPEGELSNFSRTITPKGERKFVTWMRNRDNPKFISHGYPTAAKTGRLRVVRSGEQLYYLASAGVDQPLKFLKAYRFGAEDLKRAGINGVTSGDKAWLDVRVTDFLIRADAIPGAPDVQGVAAVAVQPLAAPVRDAGGTGLFAGLLVGLALALVAAFGLAAWLFVRLRRGAAPTDAAGALVSFACPQCDRVLKTKPEMAGKKVKCARCGTAALVPSLTKLCVLVGLFLMPRIAFAQAVQEEKKYAQEYYQPLTREPDDMGPFRFRGPDSNQRVMFEPNGLRIALPTGFPEQLPGTGLELHSPVQGDFEITVGFEVLKECDPADAGKNGTRLSLGVRVDTPERNEGSISRRFDGQGVIQFSSYLAMQKNASDKPKWKRYPCVTGAKTGNLRLVRSGSMLSLYGSEGNNGNFTRFQDYSFSPLDLKMVYVNASTGGPKAFIDLRFTDLRIRADGLPNLAASAAPMAQAIAPPPSDGGRGWLVGGLLGGLALALIGVLALGAWFVTRRRGATTDPVQAGAALAELSFPCPECQRVLKPTAELAGKKIKCAQCGKAVVVPSSHVDIE